MARLVLLLRMLRPCDPAEEETALERTGGSTALGGVDDAQQQR
jgi:hypothetical protein